MVSWEYHGMSVGSSLKIAAWLLLPWTRRRPFATRDIAHSTRTSHIRNSSPPTFHPDISHPEFFPVDIPPGHLTFRILPHRHSTWTSHIRNSSSLTFHLDISYPKFFSTDIPSPDISHPEFCPVDVPSSSDISHPESHFVNSFKSWYSNSPNCLILYP